MVKRCYWIPAFIVVISLLLMACDGQTSTNHSHSTSRARSSFTSAHTDTQTTSLEVKGSVDHIDLYFDAALDQGSMVWSLTDPAGEVVWSGTLAAGEADTQELDFDPVVGDWQLEVTFEAAVGHYEHHWEATG